MINHMKKKVIKLKKTKKLKLFKILDIGSSDPTFLPFEKRLIKLELFAIDPSSEKFRSNFDKKNINLIVDYFSEKN